MELTDLRTDARYLVSPQLTSTDYSDTDVDRNLNRWYRTVIGWAITVNGNWAMAGDVITIDFLASKTDYELPVKLFRIVKGEAMYQTGGQFVPIHFFSIQNSQLEARGNPTNVNDDPNAPQAFLNGDTITVTPAPDEDVVNGLKLWVQLDLLDLSTTNNVPDLMEIIQRALSTGAAYDYARANEMWKKAAQLKKDLLGDPGIPGDTGIKGQVEALYAIRASAQRGGLKASRRTRFN